MPYAFTQAQLEAFQATISAPRFSTYLAASQSDPHKAMALYCWNSDISAAFYVVLQFAEIAVRNAAVEGIEAVYGPNWHLNRQFVRSLPERRGSYFPRKDLEVCAGRLRVAGKVVAELKFAFWQYVFISGQDASLWNECLHQVFPGIDPDIPVSIARDAIHKDIEKLRNRIAHHEPILKISDLPDHLARARQLIEWRRPEVALWLDEHEKVSALLRQRP